MAYSNREIVDYFEGAPVIAAVKSAEGLEACLKCECKVIFLLYGDVCNIGKIVESIKNSGKIAVIHIDLIDGLSQREVAVKYIKENTRADAIISTKPQMIKAAKEFGMNTVQRFFILDSMALNNITKQLDSVVADAIEILPAVNYKVIKKFSEKCHIPLIVGGLISDKEDIIQMLGAGASAVSTTKKELWDI